MKKNFGLILAIALGLSALLVTIAFQTGWVKAGLSYQEERAGAPTIVSYQGQIWDGDTPYDDTGYFKFAIVDAGGTTTYWSNDGTSTGGTEPTESISLGVDNGLFSILLGDTSLTNMTAVLDESVFSDPDTYLRIWFSADGFDPWAQLPDQKIASVPYALQAQSAETAFFATVADTLDGNSASAFQLRVTGTCPAGFAVQEINTDGSVVCELVAARPGYKVTTYSDITSAIGEGSAITIGVDGLGLVSYIKGNPDYDLMVGHCHDIACTSMTASPIVTNNAVGYFSSITIGIDGFGLIAHKDTTNGDLLISHCLDIPCTSADTYIVENSAITGNYNSIAIGSDGFGLIAYADFSGGASNYKIKVAHCTNIACSTSNVYIVDNTTTWAGRNVSLTIGTDGFGLISYSDYASEDLHVAHCSTLDCSSSTHVPIDTSGNVGGLSSIVIGTDGLGLISYSGSTPSIKVAHCSNVNCTSATINTLDSGPLVGSHSSIAIGSDGLGIIIYYDGTSQSLKVAHCADIICSSAQLQFIAAMISTDRANCITIGTDGLPLISFANGSNGTLNVIHCSNNFCIPNTRNR
ncbi:MAG: hypothetical protein MUO67_12340 [Anaerolineales bacterium]|nr:hypothetical protein [Anaerolineales bacterium]